MELCKCIIVMLHALAPVLGAAALKAPDPLAYGSEAGAARAAEEAARRMRTAAADTWSAAAVGLLTDYRVRLQRYKDLALAENNDQEDECVKDVASGVEEAATVYVESETPCIKAANYVITEAGNKVKLAIKEVRGWRRGLNFMSSACHKQHPKDHEAAVQCLSTRVDNEHYDAAIARLMLSLQLARSEFLASIEDAKRQLESCVELSVEAFSRSVGRVVENATLCREEKRLEEDKRADDDLETGVGHTSPALFRKFKCYKKC